MHIIWQFRRLKIIPFSRPSMPLSPPRVFAPCWALFGKKKKNIDLAKTKAELLRHFWNVTNVTNENDPKL